MFTDSNNMSRMEGQRFKQEDPELYYLLSLSALRSMIAQHILVLKYKFVARANDLIRNVSTEEPTISVHIRRTDKKEDGGAAALLDFSIEHVVHYLHLINNRRQLNYYKTILVLSDDPSCVQELQLHLGQHYHVHGLSNIEMLFQDEIDYNRYKVEGHRFVDTILSKDPEAVYSYHASVLVDAWAAAHHSDFLIGVGSSGVSQLIAQWMGARWHVDGNMLSLWQEDFVG